MRSQRASRRQFTAALLGFAGATGVGFPSRMALAVDVPAPGQSRIIDAIRSRGTIRAGINVALPWLGQNPSTNQFFGPAMEIAEEIAKRLGATLSLSTAASDVIIAGLQANQYDLALAPLFATPRRMEVVEFVNWTTAGQCYAVRADSPVQRLEDLDNPNVTIGTWAGTGSDQAIRAKYRQPRYNSIVMAVGGSNRMEEVLVGRIDVATLDSARAHLVAHQFPQLRIVPGGAENCIRNPDVPTPIGMAFVKGDPALARFLMALVEEMKPRIEASLARYSSLEHMMPR